jgi:uncharacterized metal-binding protein YceD (DUF177 family)
MNRKVKNKRSYSIALSGLSIGKHFFPFEIDRTFFVNFEESEVQQAALQAAVTVDKTAHFLQLEIEIAGHVTVPCDRCLDDVDLPIAFRGTPIVKFVKKTGDDGEWQDDEDILWVDTAAGELDITQYLYDSIILSLPLQRIHDEGGCNKEMIAKIMNNKEETVNY